MWAAFDQRLRELGYIEGQNITTVFVSLQGQYERAGEAADELAKAHPDIIVASGPEPALKAALAITRTLPIVMIAIDYDPLALGYVGSLARPAGNITGLFFRQIELAAKRVELLKQTLPDEHAAMAFYDQISAGQWEATRKAAATVNLDVAGVEFKDQPYDYEWGLTQIPPPNRRVAIALTSPIFFRDRERIAEFGLKHRIATVVTSPEQARAGCLISYGPDISQLFGRAAEYVARIAKGAQPIDLPIEQPTKFEMVVNLKTAKALDITLPASVLVRVDEVIE